MDNNRHHIALVQALEVQGFEMLVHYTEIEIHSKVETLLKYIHRFGINLVTPTGKKNKRAPGHSEYMQYILDHLQELKRAPTIPPDVEDSGWGLQDQHTTILWMESYKGLHPRDGVKGQGTGRLQDHLCPATPATGLELTYSCERDKGALQLQFNFTTHTIGGWISTTKRGRPKSITFQKTCSNFICRGYCAFCNSDFL